tara:strand:- start:1193 stop:1417 length:225 start_codon:yes stop_codon:yes gene_type:complete
MISKKSGLAKGKNSRNKLKKDTIKALTKEQLKSLKEKMLISILEGSMACNGVYFNRYKNFKGKDKIKCLKLMTQ